jgi:hypothetical protein
LALNSTVLQESAVCQWNANNLLTTTSIDAAARSHLGSLELVHIPKAGGYVIAYVGSSANISFGDFVTTRLAFSADLAVNNPLGTSNKAKRQTSGRPQGLNDGTPHDWFENSLNIATCHSLRLSGIPMNAF